MWEINKDFFSHVSMCICCKSFTDMTTDMKCRNYIALPFNACTWERFQAIKSKPLWKAKVNLRWAVSWDFKMLIFLHQLFITNWGNFMEGMFSIKNVKVVYEASEGGNASDWTSSGDPEPVSTVIFL